ncbi:hypothetical protein P376_2829 [Streptomyces sp. HCCB10043]|nr:hypothetical protein P376_2829 [Streptomyces sp. HCCB10043]
MRDGARGLVERQPGDRESAVSDGPQQQPGTQVHRAGPAAVRDAYGAHPATPALDLHDLGVEAEHDAALAVRGGRGVRPDPGEPLEHRGPVARPGRVDRRRRTRIVVVHHQLHARHMLQREEFGAGVRGVLGTPPPQHHHLPDPARPERVQGVGGDVGGRERLRVGDQDPGDVEGDIAVADHDDPLGGEVDALRDGLRVGVVPGDERRGRQAAGQLLTRYPEPLVRGGADRVDHRVVVGRQLLGRDVPAHLDPQVHPDPGVGVEAGEGVADLLRRGVVGGHPVPDEAARHRQPVDQGHLGGGVQQQVLRRVHPGGPGADDGHPQRPEVGGQAPLEDGLAPDMEVRPVDLVANGERLLALVVGGVDVRVLPLPGGQRVHREDRVHRAGVRAGPAVDARPRVDVQHLRGAEGAFLRRRVDAVDRAHGHAGGVVAAGLGDRVGHGPGSDQVRALVEREGGLGEQTGGGQEVHQPRTAGPHHRLVVRVALRGGQRTPFVEPGLPVDLRVHHAGHDEVRGDGDDERVDLPPRPPRALQPLEGLVPGELHVPGLLHDVDVVDGADERHDPLVAHPVPLHHVEDLLGDQDRRVRRLAERQRLERPAQLHHRAARPVVRRAQLLRAAREHDRVAALLGYLGERPLELRARRVLHVDVPQHHLLEDHLEPDPGTGDRSRLLPGELLALRLGQLGPVRGAVEAAPLRARAVELLVQRRLPVHLGGRVVRQLRGRTEQPPRDVVALGTFLDLRRNGAAGHAAAPWVECGDPWSW